MVNRFRKKAGIMKEQNKSKDGIYQLFIKANDKAGNKIKDNYKVVFRVNRWGADFILNHKIKESIDGHYLREEPNIILKERCVKQTKSRVIRRRKYILL